jgi:hypothetical protein
MISTHQKIRQVNVRPRNHLHGHCSDFFLTDLIPLDTWLNFTSFCRHGAGGVHACS